MSQPTLDTEGHAAPPRRNGEIVFEAPWQSRAFGLTMSLCEAGAIAWSDFRARLIDEIGRFDAANPVLPEAGAEPAPYAYWDHWLAALEGLITERGLCSAEDLAGRVGAYAERPHGHDH